MSGLSPALYPCAITHVRTTPVQRAFTYRSYLWLIDLDHLPHLPLALSPLAAFRVEDHLGDRAAPSIRSNVDAYLSRHDIDLDGGRVLMLASARVLGHVFNPISVFWCYGADGALAAVLAEVHNTYSQRHVYLLRPDPRGRSEAAKEFYVSPFLPVSGRYRLRLPAPGERLRLAVTLDLDGEPALVAGVRGTRRPFALWRLLGYSLRFPWASLRVTALIRWQAIQLLARRLPVLPRPAHLPQEGVQ
ncbi:MAG TPA: DUF1365 domain-containing protein [Streptosporangiaceae bacterium]|nr:DUF1365 domain-containing protein [Streptosporangiaceae bacterium]